MSARLSKNFTVREFEFSQTATRLGIKNKLTAAHRANAALLCEKVLEPIRAYYLGRAVIISSGYRSEALNAVTPGASTTSQHCKGEAADIKVIGVAQHRLFTDIINNRIPGLVWDQVIDEFSTWVHISYNKGNNRKDKFKARKNRTGKTVYTRV